MCIRTYRIILNSNSQAGVSKGYSSLVGVDESTGGVLHEATERGCIDFARFPLDFGRAGLRGLRAGGGLELRSAAAQEVPVEEEEAL